MAHRCTRCGRIIDPEDGYFYCDCYEDDDEDDVLEIQRKYNK